MNTGIPPRQGLTLETTLPATVRSDSLERAITALRLWQTREDKAGTNRHGRCLEAVRLALLTVGLHLPQPQPRPNNLALYNYQLLRQDPERWAWQPAPPQARYTLDYFAHVGHLPDGRVAGHVALTDHAAQVLYSSWDYPLTSRWQAVHVGSFVPIPTTPAVQQAGYLDLKVFEQQTGRLLHRVPSCVLLASDGHAYLQARVASEALDVPCEVNDAYRDGVLIFRRDAP